MADPLHVVLHWFYNEAMTERGKAVELTNGAVEDSTR